MIRRLFKRLGYHSADDAVDFIMAGIGTVPILLMLSGWIFAGGAALMILILLLAVVGAHTPLPPAPPEEKITEKDETPRR